MKFPIILKGEYSSASSDIHKFNDKESLLEFFATNSFFDNFLVYLIQIK